jgi:hypothetical protein
VAKIELPESWADVADPLRALLAEVEREAHVNGATPDLAAMLERWNVTAGRSSACDCDEGIVVMRSGEMIRPTEQI